VIYCGDYRCTHSVVVDSDRWGPGAKVHLQGLRAPRLCQAQGIAEMKAEGKDCAGGKRPSGRPEDTERNAGIAQQLLTACPGQLQNAEDCSRSTIFKVSSG
jgi:hypothetical protein